MVFLRVVVLLFWVFYSWSMGQIPPSGLNGFGTFVAMSFFVAAPVLYLLPIWEARWRDHPNTTSIALVDVLLGWTLLGWVIALVWACSKPTQVQAGDAAPSPSPTGSRACPFCAEAIQPAAIKCKHCGSDLAPQPA